MGFTFPTAIKELPPVGTDLVTFDFVNPTLLTQQVKVTRVFKTAFTNLRWCFQFICLFTKGEGIQIKTPPLPHPPTQPGPGQGTTYLSPPHQSPAGQEQGTSPPFPFPSVSINVGPSIGISVSPSVGPSVGPSVRLSLGASVLISVRPSVSARVSIGVSVSVGISVGPSVGPSVSYFIFQKFEVPVGESVILFALTTLSLTILPLFISAGNNFSALFLFLSKFQLHSEILK